MRKPNIAEILVIFACLSVLSLPVLNGLIISPSFSEFLKNFAEKKLIEVASNMSTRIESQAVFTDATSFSQDFLRTIETDRKLLQLAKLKIFTPTGLTLYSTDAEDINSYTDKDFFDELITSRNARTNLKVEDKKNSGEEIFLIETYVPIIKNSRAIGIFEIYFDMTETRQNLTRVVEKINGIVLTVSLSLLGAVLFSAYLTRRNHLLREKAEAEKDALINDLSLALGEIKTLRGILPLCSYCKKIRNDSGYWEQVDVYIDQHSDADISHGICPDCAAEHFPELYDKTRTPENREPSGDPADDS